jgi:hypothetical protein
MDTHKKQHQVAWVHPDTGEIQEFAVANTLREIERMVKRLRKQAPGEIHVCYEAGLCGFVLQRRLEKLGCVAKGIAPSLVWRKPGDRVKTDRRDARKLLAQFVAGPLTEAGRHYRHPYAVSKSLKVRRKDQPAWAVDRADRAAKRLYRRYRHLIERGKSAPVAILAVVREPAGFVWAMLRQLPQQTQSPSP